jgi:type II secretory pathway component PulF
VTAIISILLYNGISFVYVLLNGKESLNEYYMSKEIREINSKIEAGLSLKRSVNISELFPDAQEACLTVIDFDQLF